MAHKIPTTTDVRAAFRRQAQACRALGSPFTGMVCDLLANRLDGASRFGGLVLMWPGDILNDAVALRAAGALNALARSGRAPGLVALYPPNPAPEPNVLWKAIAAAVREHDDALHDGLESPPQTNEVARSAVLLGGCIAIAAATGRPLALYEIGSSGGLNLALDRYRYELGEPSWGDAASSVVIRCAWQGRPADPVPLAIAARAGCDRSPLDPASPADRERLLAYIWPDQRERVARTEAALDLAAAMPWRVEPADAADWVERRFAAPATPGIARVLLHTIVWQYLADDTKARIKAAMQTAAARATEDAPLAWLSMEADGAADAAVRLTLRPGGERRLLGRADFHGRWVRWAG